jgi:hypothetical protein
MSITSENGSNLPDQGSYCPEETKLKRSFCVSLALIVRHDACRGHCARVARQIGGRSLVRHLRSRGVMRGVLSAALWRNIDVAILRRRSAGGIRHPGG